MPASRRWLPSARGCTAGAAGREAPARFELIVDGSDVALSSRCAIRHIRICICRADVACLFRQVDAPRLRPPIGRRDSPGPRSPSAPAPVCTRAWPVTESAGHRDPLLAQLGSPLAVGEKVMASANRLVTLARSSLSSVPSPPSACLEQVHQRLVHGSRLEGGERPAETQRRTREFLGVAQRLRQAAGPAECLLGLVEVARPPLRIAPAQQQLTAAVARLRGRWPPTSRALAGSSRPPPCARVVR